MKKIIILLAAALLLVAPVHAQQKFGDPVPLPTQPVAKGVPTNAPSTQITTTAPVTSDTKISIGSLAAEILQWIAAAFAVPIGALISAWLWKLLQASGVQVNAGMRAQLQSVIVNGLNAAAAANAERLKGRGQVEIKSAIVADAVAYTQAHAAETIKALGLDPKSGEAVEAIKARIETAITDPSQPTPTAVAPAGAPPKVASVGDTTITVTEQKKPLA